MFYKLLKILFPKTIKLIEDNSHSNGFALGFVKGKEKGEEKRFFDEFKKLKQDGVVINRYGAIILKKDNELLTGITSSQINI